MVAVTVGRRNGERPVSAVCRVTPALHRSPAGVVPPDSSRSGGMYSGEPISVPVRVIAVPPSTVAMPKSVMTTRSPPSTITLPGLMSRCTTPARCAACSPSSSPRASRAARAGGGGPSARSSSSSERPRSSSITTHGVPPWSKTSCTVTTDGCSIRAAARASRSTRCRVSARSASGSDAGSSTSLTATSRSRAVSQARHTAPMPPRPSSPPSR